MLVCSISLTKAQVYSFGADTFIHCMDGGYGYILYDAPLWVGTNYGVFGIIVGNEHFDSLNSPLPSNYITAFDLHYSDNRLWIGTNQGLCRKDYGGNYWTCFNSSDNDLPSDSITCILDADHDSIWIGTRNGLVLYLQALDSFQWFNTSNSLLPSNHITCLEKFSFEPHYDFPYPIFVGTESGLLGINNNNWTEYDTSNSTLTNNHITAITADGFSPNVNAWIATFGGGVNHLNNDTFITYTTSNQKIKSDTLQFIESLFDGNIVYTGNGFDSLYSFNYFTDNFAAEWISKPVASASQNRGNGDWGWIGTDHEIYTFDFTEGIQEIKNSIQWKATIDNDMVYLFNLPPLYGKTSLKIIDMCGNIMEEQAFSISQSSSKSFTIPHLAGGIYIVQLQSSLFSQAIRVLKPD